MKKIIIVALLSLGITLSCVPVSATENHKDVEFLDNGSYFETIIVEHPSTRASGTKTGTKTTYYKNNNNQVMWSVAVTGTFNYTSSSATCTKSTVSTTSPASTWKIASKSASKSGNKATGKATAKQYQNGACIFTTTRSVTLTCGANGVLS